MLGRRLPGILPPLTRDEALEVTRIHSVAGTLPAGRPIILVPPFRAPHHGASAAAIVGGGAVRGPGEASLAHRGVLLMDELPEFPRPVLESLRQPLEDGVVSVARVGGHALFPARFRLVATMNLCPCGGRGDPAADCACSPQRISGYREKVSRALLDRFDLVVAMPRPRAEELAAPPGEASAAVRLRVVAARERLRDGDVLRRTEAASALLDRAVERVPLSGRGRARVARVARTVAALAGSDAVLPEHLAEALSYRSPAGGRRPHERSQHQATQRGVPTLAPVDPRPTCNALAPRRGTGGAARPAGGRDRRRARVLLVRPSVARSLGRELAAAGLVVVSGMARGIDGEAHRGALDVGGITVAVLGCGIDRDYPAAHRDLAGRIVERGLIVSEYEPGVEPAPWRFPARNRIIAGLCAATVVVEARERSGALITADFALEDGREVMVVPGEITSAVSAGSNALLRLGATPVTAAADVLEAYGIERMVEAPARIEGIAGDLLHAARRRPREHRRAGPRRRRGSG